MCDTKTNLTNQKKSVSTLGIHHLGISVPDITKTASFFIEHLHFNKVGEKPDYPAIFVSDGTVMLTIWQIENAKSMIPFNRKNNVGLHHFALKVSTVEQLHELNKQLTQLDNVEVEFHPERLGESPFEHMMCIIPGGIRLELISS